MNKKTVILALNLALAPALFVSNAYADQALCQASYINGVGPKIINQKPSKKTQEICYEGYATEFSGLTRTPLWSADHLTAERVAAACIMNRKDAFHPDPNLSGEIRSELSDYVHSGYDRGHMVPSADMPDPSSQAESFSLANMTPQLHANNAGIWEDFENGARNVALNGHDIYVVSGPLFEGQTVQQLQQRVMVPTSFFKAIYDVTTGQAGVFITPNTAEQVSQLISIDDLVKRAGIDAFPGIAPAIKAIASPVASPDKRTHCPR